MIDVLKALAGSIAALLIALLLSLGLTWGSIALAAYLLEY